MLYIEKNRAKYFLLTCLSSVELRPVTKQMQTVVSQKPCWTFSNRGGVKKKKIIFMHDVGNGWNGRTIFIGEVEGGQVNEKKNKKEKTVEILATVRR